MAKRIWSATRLKAYFACARRFKHDKFVKTQEVTDGLERHSIVETGYLRGNIEAITTLVPLEEGQTFRKEQLEIVQKAAQRGYLPLPEQVLSVEGRDLPPEYTTEKYGRKMFLVQGGVLENGDEWWIQGAGDIVFVDPNVDDTLFIGDWKSRSQDDGEIQGSCYALAYSIIYGGFLKYVFEQRSLTMSWPHDKYEFLAADMDKVRAFIAAIGQAMDADTEFLPSENKWCNYCGIKEDCPVWLKMSQTPIVESLPAVKEFTLPVEFGPLIALKKRSALYEKIAEGLKDRCNKEALKILEHGPQKHEGRIYTKGLGVTSYEVKEGKMEEVVSIVTKALEVLKSDVKLEDLFSFDVTWARELIEKASKKSVNNDESKAFKEAHKALFSPKTYDKINEKAG